MHDFLKGLFLFMTESLVRHEVLFVADAVAREKGVDKEEVLCAMEQAFERAARLKYGEESDLKATIDRKTGKIVLVRRRKVVEAIENPARELTVREAQREDPSLNLDDYLIEPLPPIDFGRMSVQVVRQVISGLLRDAVRLHEYEEYKERVGDIISGVVKSVDFGNVILDLGRAEGFLRRDELIQRETFRPGDRVRAYIKDVRQDPRAAQILLSRTHPQFMAKLFMQEVPEVYDGLIEIKAIARDPGSRAKMGVISKDPSIDPVGSCVGVRGSRVQAVSGELGGEKIDIVNWSSDLVTFVVNALTPAEVTKVVMGEDERRLEVVVPDAQLSLAIGRKGQNVRLACELTNVSIDILTETAESQRRSADVIQRSEVFQQALTIDDVMARLLVAEGFETLEEVAFVPMDDFLSIEGFTEELASELQKRAIAYLETRDAGLRSQFEEAGGKPDLAGFGDIPLPFLVTLAQKGVYTIQDLADLSGDELLEMGEATLTQEQADQWIMGAREHLSGLAV